MTPSAAPPVSGPLRNDGRSHGVNALSVAGFADRDSLAPLWIGIVVAVIVHASIATTTTLAPPKRLSERVEMALYKPPPPPPPEPPPPPPPEPEKPKPKPPPPKEPPPEPPPPPPNQEPPPEPPAEPPPVVTGISMQSTVNGGGPAVRVGNTTFGDPNQEKFVDPKDVKPYQGGSPEFKAARQSAITREAKLVKDYKGPYPRDLLEQGIEGTVVLLIEIAKDGSVRGVKLAKSCGNATLDRLAQEYAKRFRFEPAEVDGVKVDSVRRHSYRFDVYE